jgi:methionyl-tRNA synthetase
LQRYRESMDPLDLRAGADAIWGLVSKANLYVQQSAPWSLAKTGKESELDDVLGALARVLTRLAVLASPFIPGKAQALWEMLSYDGEVASAGWSAAEQPRVSGHTVSRAEVLFPKPASV